MTSNEALGNRCSDRERIPSDDVDLVGGKSVFCTHQLIDQLTVAFDQRDSRRTSRRKLEAQRAGARKQIDAARCVEVGNKVLDPVKKRFSHAVGRRPQSDDIGDRQRGSLPAVRR